jgi:hypothetical protein
MRDTSYMKHTQDQVHHNSFHSDQQVQCQQVMRYNEWLYHLPVTVPDNEHWVSEKHNISTYGIHTNQEDRPR